MTFTSDRSVGLHRQREPRFAGETSGRLAEWSKATTGDNSPKRATAVHQTGACVKQAVECYLPPPQVRILHRPINFENGSRGELRSPIPGGLVSHKTCGESHTGETSPSKRPAVLFFCPIKVGKTRKTKEERTPCR